MTFLNARAKNIGNDEGDVYTYFTSKLANLIQKNGGDHYFNWITLECTEQPAPHPVGTKTYLRLTSENFTITQMEKSFVTVLLEFYVKLSQSVDVTADTNKLIRLFVGLKNAAEFFGKLDSICNNVMLKNTQDDAVREQFAYNSIKGRSQKATAKFSHSTWENVSMMSESVCGIYVPLADIADGQPHKVQMELTIPYQDFLKYQAFTLYPNEIVGELKELVQTSMEGFVWAPISPKIVKENIEFLDNSTIAEDIPSNIPITRKFTQVGNPATIITEYKTGTQSDALEGYIKVPNGTENGNDLKTGAVTLTITAATVQMMRTNIAGFNIKPDCLAGLRSYLSHNAILIPSQTHERRQFASAARSTGIDATTDISLSNATNITIMFPKRATDATCFDNIMYQNVQLSVNKHSYPDTEVSTIGARFYQMQLVADELDGTLEATQEYEDSFTQPLNDPTTGKRYANCRSDGTSFHINFQLERSNAGYVFDGIDTGTQTVPITFRGQPIYSGDNDTYYIYDPDHKDQHPPAPELWICQDTYFTMSVGGLEYHGPNTPAGFE